MLPYSKCVPTTACFLALSASVPDNKSFNLSQYAYAGFCPPWARWRVPGEGYHLLTPWALLQMVSEATGPVHGDAQANHWPESQVPNFKIFSISMKKAFGIFIGIALNLQIALGQFSSVAQSCPALCDPNELQHARPPCPSPTPGVYPNPCPLSQ